MIELVAIGASAGGLHALTRVLGVLPPSFPLPIAVVQHRGLEDADALVGAMRAALPIPIFEVEDKQPISPGRVFLAPADYHLLVDRGVFALSTDARVNSARPAIDALFDSAAQVYRERLLAVLLTGASSDGSRGAAHVRSFGGRVIVQDPDEAESKMMPRSALEHANMVLTLDEIARHLLVVAAEAHVAAR